MLDRWPIRASARVGSDYHGWIGPVRTKTHAQTDKVSERLSYREEDKEREKEWPTDGEKDSKKKTDTQ